MLLVLKVSAGILLLDLKVTYTTLTCSFFLKLSFQVILLQFPFSSKSILSPSHASSSPPLNVVSPSLDCFSLYLLTTLPTLFPSCILSFKSLTLIKKDSPTKGPLIIKLVALSLKTDLPSEMSSLPSGLLFIEVPHLPL